MRFTTSQASFKSGRLSPKLFNRVDTVQYRDGVSELVGLRPIPEGGVERIKGYRLRNADIGYALATNNTCRTISFSIQGIPMTGSFNQDFGDPTNYAIVLEIFAYPFASGASQSVQLVQDGAKLYDLYKFDWTIVDNYLVITHYDGDFMPVFIKFDNTGTIEDTYGLLTASPITTLLNANYALPTSLWTSVSNSLHLTPPMADLGSNSATLAITSMDINGRVDITCAGNPDVIAILQRSPVLYLEGLGQRDFGDGFARKITMGDYYVVFSTIANGVTAYPTAIYNHGGGTYHALDFAGISSTNVWSYSLWYNENFPRTVTANEGRLIFGGTPEQPLTVFGSKIGAPMFFNQLRRCESGSEFCSVLAPSGDTIMSDPFVYTVSTKGDSAISFLQVAENLVIGTDRREYIASGGDTVLSPLSVSIKARTAQGSVPLRACSTGKAVYYVSSDGKQLFKFKYNAANGTFISQEISLLFNDLIENDNIKQVEWCPHISSLLVVMESGNLYGIMDNEQAEAVAFYKTGQTNVASVSCVVVNNREADGIGSHVFMIKSGIGVCTYEQQYFELGLNDSCVTEERLEQTLYLFLDKAINYVRGASGGGSYNWDWDGGTTTISTSGIPVPTFYFAVGSTVYIYNLDTREYTAWTVGPDLGGYANCPLYPASTNFVIGIAPPTAELATMPVEAGQQWGTAQMGIKNIDTIGMRFYKSYSVEMSSNETDWQEVVIADDEGNARTGREDRKFSSSPGHDQIIYLRNTKPEPLTILGLNMRGVSNDG
jgi:hypothetical protein